MVPSTALPWLARACHQSKFLQLKVPALAPFWGMTKRYALPDSQGRICQLLRLGFRAVRRGLDLQQLPKGLIVKIRREVFMQRPDTKSADFVIHRVMECVRACITPKTI